MHLIWQTENVVDIGGYNMTKPRIDATETMEIRVMRRDIDSAIPRCVTDCAMAQRIKRIKGVEGVRVGAGIVLVEKKDEILRFELLPEDKKKIHDFDKAGYFRPDTYVLQPPKTKLGARKGTKPGSNKREGKARNVLREPPLRHL
jgi:hypothetical protein